MVSDATMGWGPGVSPKATAEHWSIRRGTRTPEDTGHREAGEKMGGSWGPGGRAFFE